MLAIALTRSEAEAAASVAAGLQLGSLRFGYSIRGDDPLWRPLRAFDDGRQTFIEFPASIAVGEAPPLFVLGRRAKPNSSITGFVAATISWTGCSTRPSCG